MTLVVECVTIFKYAVDRCFFVLNPYKFGVYWFVRFLIFEKRESLKMWLRTAIEVEVAV